MDLAKNSHIDEKRAVPLIFIVALPYRACWIGCSRRNLLASWNLGGYRISGLQDLSEDFTKPFSHKQ